MANEIFRKDDTNEYVKKNSSGQYSEDIRENREEKCSHAQGMIT